MPTAEQARDALALVTSTAVASITELVTVDAEATRNALMAATPDVVSYYSDGSAALAADYYDEAREAVRPASRYVAEPISVLRADKIRTGVLWAVQPLYLVQPDRVLAVERIGEVVQYETANPFRDTITTNTRRDPAARGWRRITATGCKFCVMLAGRGAVYRADTAHFAAHPNCGCTAEPVFQGQGGEEPTPMQYVASQRTRTPAQQQALRDYLAAMP